MRKNVGSVLVVIVGVILAVDVAMRLAPKEAAAQPPPFDFDQYEQRALDDIAKALTAAQKHYQEQADETKKRFREEIELQEAILEKYKALREQLLAEKRWPEERGAAVDMEIDSSRNHYILWENGEVTNGGTLP